MPFVKIWIHVVWATKGRKPLLAKAYRQKIFQHIHDNAIKKGILIDVVNGHKEHVHCLFRLKNDQTISKLLQLLKGESSFWVNKEKILNKKLIWQEEYYAVSVSESQVDYVRKYIRGQERHHSHKSFVEEYDEFILKYKFQVIQDLKGRI